MDLFIQISGGGNEDTCSSLSSSFFGSTESKVKWIHKDMVWSCKKTDFDSIKGDVETCVDALCLDESVKLNQSSSHLDFGDYLVEEREIWYDFTSVAFLAYMKRFPERKYLHLKVHIKVSSKKK